VIDEDDKEEEKPSLRSSARTVITRGKRVSTHPSRVDVK